ncbi:MAG: thiamine pyrophosphate-binding protein, partial [Negativicutes bacterium]|nr:thiamine pyrophosphate-binding protein [Negativicutes bacterium]
MKTFRLTVAQALVRFLDNQYVEFDGQEIKFVKGIFTIFGHGNVVGLGQALWQEPGGLVVHQGRNEQGMAHAATGFAKQKLRRQIYASLGFLLDKTQRYADAAMAYQEAGQANKVAEMRDKQAKAEQNLKA